MLSPKINLTFIFALFSLIFYQKNYAGTNFSSTKEEFNPIEYSLLYYKNSASSLDKNILNYTFKEMPKSNSLGFLNGEYWFQLTINNVQDYKDLIAYIPTHNINRIDIYQLINNQLEYISSTGNSVRQEDLSVNYKFPAFKINTSNKTVYYLKVDFPNEANFPIKIIPEKSFVSYIMNKKTINSFYYGSAIMIILLNLNFFFKFRDKTYLYYMLFLLSLMINFLLYDGSLINVFRNNHNYYRLELFIHISNELWFILFSIKFLNINQRHPLISKLFYIFPLIVLVLYICNLVNNNFIYIAIGDAIGISLFPILWLFGFLFIKSIPYAKFYVLGYLLIVPFAVFFIIGYPFGLWEVHGDMNIVKIASWLDIIVFTYAITYRMKTKLETGDNEIKKLQNHLDPTLTKTSKKETTQDSYLELLKENNFSKHPLTLREVDILKHLHQGYSNTLISEKLFISKNTVKYHVRNIYNKVEVKNRIELNEKISSIKARK